MLAIVRRKGLNQSYYSTDAICVSDIGIDSMDPEDLLTAKQAALYYNNVWVLHIFHYFENRTRFRNLLPPKILNNILPGNYGNVTYGSRLGYILKQLEPKLYDLEKVPRKLMPYDLKAYEHYINNSFVSPIKRHPIDAKSDNPIHNTPVSLGEGFREIILRYARLLGLNTPELVIPPNANSEIRKSQIPGVKYSLIDLQLIDVSRASWNQIIELRNDPKSTKKLHNFRLFMNKNYSGKPLSFIEDDLGRLEDEYQDTCKKFGFERRTSTISLILSSKSFLALGGASVVSLLSGEPLVASIAALSATTVEFAKIKLHLVQHKFSFERFQNDHQIAFLAYAKKQLDEKNG